MATINRKTVTTTSYVVELSEEEALLLHEMVDSTVGNSDALRNLHEAFGELDDHPRNYLQIQRLRDGTLQEVPRGD